MVLTTARPRAMQLAALACVLPACTQQGRLLVVVDSNIADLEVVSMRVRRSSVADGESTDITLARDPLPLRLGVEPIGGSGLVRIEAVGLRGSAPVVESVATINVLPGPTRVWRMYLDARCEGVLDCADDETCVAGVCESVRVVEPEDLPLLGVDGGGTPVDAERSGDATDAARVDAPACASCAPRANTIVTCPGGDCAYSCTLGFDDCDGDEATGCEAGLDTSQEHCGGCARPCAATDTCFGGSCYPPSTIAEVACGTEHTCVRYSDGRVYCWGNNEEGQLGLSDPRRSLVPLAVPGLSGATDIALAEQHGCASHLDGSVSCWGRDRLGTLGPDPMAAPAPVAIPGVAGATAVALTRERSCALTSGGEVLCWGLVDGDGNVPPRAISGIADAEALTVGDGHTCVLRPMGTVSCVGTDEFGQLGDGPMVAAAGTLVDVVGLAGASAVAAAENFTCALNDVDKWGCWGDGPFGDGTAAWRDAPAGFHGAGFTGLTAAAGERACAWRSTRIECWERTTAPVEVVAPVASIVSADIGPGHACLTDGATVWCWGQNNRGQLGDGTVTSSAVPVRVVGLP
jgi:hypothetical protein